uniref:Uncharacterized protein n=1 Tax=Tetranychus urticae TaxID=32264 RepID=T1KBK1_TETUR
MSDEIRNAIRNDRLIHKDGWSKNRITAVLSSYGIFSQSNLRSQSVIKVGFV